MKSPTSGAIRPFREDDEAALRGIMKASLEVDAFPGFDAWDLEGAAVSIIGAPDGTTVAIEDGVVCGYVSPGHENLTVHPQFRQRSHGRRLFAAGLDLAAKAGWDVIQLYVPESGAGQAFATAMGMTYRSSMWRLARAPETAVPEPVFPGEVIVRTFGNWLPLKALVDLLNDSFADHPGPVSWTLAEIQYAHSRPDFDPSSTTLVVPADRPDEPIGFVRTGLGPADEDSTVVGEVRLVGVLQPWRGRGLGRELLRWGVAQLRARRGGRVQLSVE